MTRLITLVLCLLTASGIYPGSAAASRNASQAHARTLPTAHASQRGFPAVDPAWATQGPAVLAPPARGIAPHAGQQHHSTGVAASGWTSLALDPTWDRSSIGRNAGWAITRRGYHATGPPGLLDVSPSRNSLARPA